MSRLNTLQPAFRRRLECEAAARPAGCGSPSQEPKSGGRSQSQRSRDFRHPLTPTEDKIWQAVRGRQLGFKIRRQHPVGRFIADFRMGDTYSLSCRPARARKRTW